MIFRHLLVWATVWLSNVQAQSEPVLDRSIVLNKAWFFHYMMNSSVDCSGHPGLICSAAIFKDLRKTWQSMNGKSSSISRNHWIIWSGSIYLWVEPSPKAKDGFSDLNLTHTIVKFTSGFWEMELNTSMGDVGSLIVWVRLERKNVC